MISDEDFQKTLENIEKMSPEQMNGLIDFVNRVVRHRRAMAAAKAKTLFQVGNTVKLNGLKPKYLNGLEGRIISMNNTRIEVDLQMPVGKFLRGIVRVPASALTKVNKS